MDETTQQRPEKTYVFSGHFRSDHQQNQSLYISLFKTAEQNERGAFSPCPTTIDEVPKGFKLSPQIGFKL
jgi:hypothetical protein